MSAALALVLMMQPHAVLRVAREVSISDVTTATSGRSGAPGSVLHTGDRIVTSRSGWAELELFDGSRVRVGSQSAVVLQPAFIALSRGRLWIESTGRLDVRVGSSSILTEARASLVVEASIGRFLATMRAGVGRSGTSSFRRGEVFDGEQVIPGGEALAQIASAEAEIVSGDRVGILDFVLRRPNLASTRSPPRPDSFVFSHSGLVRGLRRTWTEGLDRAVAAPPFYSEEIPEAGPNLHVQVEFDE